MLQQLDGFYEVSEQRIVYWYQWLNHLLKYQIEPTSAMSMDAIIQHLSSAHNGNTTQPRNILVVLSGGNVDTSMRQLLWSQDFLSETPSL
jgi:threonine dehydratase